MVILIANIVIAHILRTSLSLNHFSLVVVVPSPSFPACSAAPPGRILDNMLSPSMPGWPAAALPIPPGLGAALEPGQRKKEKHWTENWGEADEEEDQWGVEKERSGRRKEDRGWKRFALVLWWHLRRRRCAFLLTPAASETMWAKHDSSFSCTSESSGNIFGPSNTKIIQRGGGLWDIKLYSMRFNLAASSGHVIS